MSCPVDHSSSSAKSHNEGRACPIEHDSDAHMQAAQPDKCPVDHNTRATWASFAEQQQQSTSTTTAIAIQGFSATTPTSTAAAESSTSTSTGTLPTEREISSIPRADGEKWVYPSQAQFFAALTRKQHRGPKETDMRVVVPIHNAVNERAWAEVGDWERGRGAEACGGPRLVSFKGRPGDLTPRARWKTWLGYQAPFDRHDWVVDRCGTRVRYVIDFYTAKPIAGNLAFYMDVRPALDNWEGVKMRVSRFWERWVGSAPVPAQTQTQMQMQRTSQQVDKAVEPR